MKRIFAVCVLSLVTSTLIAAPPVIDGVFDPTEGWILFGTSANPNGGGAGANLSEFYLYPDQTAFYACITTNNSASWDVAYGIGLDIDQIQNSGYYGNVGVDQDAWGRYIYFINSSSMPYAVEWEFYWWWDGASGAVTSYNSPQWTGSGWNYPAYGTYAYSGDATSGLQVLEFKVNWTDLGFAPGSYPLAFYTSTWLAGGGGSSAVDAIPPVASVADGGGSEWTDTDDVLEGVGVTGVSESEIEHSSLNVVPQVNKLVLSTSSPVSIDIQIYAANGSLAGEKKLGLVSGTSTVHFVNLNPGVYFVKVKSSEGSISTHRLVVIH